MTTARFLAMRITWLMHALLLALVLGTVAPGMARAQDDTAQDVAAL